MDEVVEKVFEDMELNKVRWVTLTFTDLRGYQKQVTIKRKPEKEWLEKLFTRGVGKLDGSSIEGFQDISESDLMLRPDPTTYAILPWSGDTARLISNILIRGEDYPKDPRGALAKTVEKMGPYIPLMGAEVEFFILNGLSTIVNDLEYTFLTSLETLEAPVTQGYPYRPKTGYYMEWGLDTVIGFRRRLVEVLEGWFGMEVESHHHEVAIAGQSEINIRYGDPVSTADNVMTLKYVARVLAREEFGGITPLFMPKPIPTDNGSGLHMHISLVRNGRNVFYDPDDEYAHLSQEARYFIGGLLEHGRALSALVSPTVNSYHRLVPGYEAPIYLTWGRSNRSAAVRVPFYDPESRNAKLEYRPPDPSCNPYIAMAGILAAGMDGIKKKRDPGPPVDENVYKMPKQRVRELGIKTLPASLLEALEELESDMTFLEKYIPKELLESYIELKREEAKTLAKYPSPAEFQLYSTL